MQKPPSHIKKQDKFPLKPYKGNNSYIPNTTYNLYIYPYILT